MRETLPFRRASLTFELAAHATPGGAAVTVGFFDDGRAGEVFISAHKRDCAVDPLQRDIGILISYCLQAGCDVELLRRGMTRAANGAPLAVAGAVLDRLCEVLAEDGA